MAIAYKIQCRSTSPLSSIQRRQTPIIWRFPPSRTPGGCRTVSFSGPTARVLSRPGSFSEEVVPLISESESCNAKTNYLR